MEIVAILLAIIGFGAAGGVWLRSSKLATEAENRRQILEAQLEASETRGNAAEASAKKVSAEAERLEIELAEAVARRDEKATAKAMWALELERSYRQWRDVIVPGVGQTEPTDHSAGAHLAFALGCEVERLREEVGVSIRYDGDAALDIEAEVALGVLRVAQELLALAAKQADEVSVTLDEGDEPSISLTVACEGWEPPTDAEDDSPAGELTQTVDTMVKRLDGWARWSTPGEDRISVTVRVPAPPAVIDLEEASTATAGADTP